MEFDSWALPGMKKDSQSITHDWEMVNQTLIDGVQIKQIASVPTNYGHLTEVYRRDWQLNGEGVEQVFMSMLEPGGMSAWHVHAVTTDRIFVAHGQFRIVLFDSRKDSPTYGKVNEFLFGTVKPALLVIPPKVWHGVQNTASIRGTLINVVDSAYRYEAPDHFRLPVDTDQIPYRFQAPVGQDALRGANR